MGTKLKYIGANAFLATTSKQTLLSQRKESNALEESANWVQDLALGLSY